MKRYYKNDGALAINVHIHVAIMILCKIELLVKLEYSELFPVLHDDR